MSGDQRAERLRRLLGGPDTAWLVERVRRRLARGGAPTGTVSLAQPSPSERRAVESLLGRGPGTGASLSVSLTDLDAQVRRSGLHPAGLAAAVEELVGPIVDEAAGRAAETEAWDRALRPLAALDSSDEAWVTWRADPATTGLIRRLAGSPETATTLVADLVATLDVLPTSGMTLAGLAAGATGDPHALDRGRPLATLALSAIRARWAVSPDEEGGTPAQRRRALWDSVGVLVDELSSTVLLLNVPLAGDGFLAGMCAGAAEAGEPVVVTLRQIAREPVTWVVPVLHLCENPAVVAAAAERMGPECQPLVCVSGQPTTAALRLLDVATTARTEIRYHGDFDWGGLRIANLLYQRLQWRPWRFDTAAYTAVVEASRASGRLGGHLTGAAVPARWDPDLAGAMSDSGRRVEEELVLDDLLGDLAG